MSGVLDSRCSVIALALLAFSTLPAPAQAEGGKSNLNVVLENDIFAGTDDNYTNGLQIDFLSAPRGHGSLAARLIAWLPGNKDGEARFGWQIGQKIFTPRDTDTADRLPNQRPYAAWLYGGLSLVYATDRHVDSWSLNVGTVGPDALGEEFQNGIHDLIDDENALGWDNQIPNQVGAMLVIERKWRALALAGMGGFGIDALPHVGVSLGNIEQYASAGFTFRLGRDLDNDFGPPRIRPSLPGTGFFVPRDRWSWYLFLGLDARYVDRNIFLDDHEDAELSNIEKKDWVGDIQAGFVLARGNLRFSYTHVHRSEQFDQQIGPDRFGSLAVTWRF